MRARCLEVAVFEERCADEAINVVASANLRRCTMRKLCARPAIGPACFSRCRLIACSSKCDAYLIAPDSLYGVYS